MPTADEALRVKAYLIVQRNQVRDYLDVAALADRIGLDHAAQVLADIDRFYDDRSGHPESVVSALLPLLARPHPRDAVVTSQLAAYKGLAPRWTDWSETTAICGSLAERILAQNDG